MKNFQRASLACSASIIAALCLIAPASATTPTKVDGPNFERVSVTADIGDFSSQVTPAVVSAPATAKVSFDRPAVITTPAPPPPPPVVEVQTAPPVAAAQNVQQAQYAPAAQPAPAPVAAARSTQAASVPAVAAAKAPAQAPVSASGKGATIAAAALGQIGVSQDCTMLVTNSLKAVGINFHDWPAGYMSLGSVIPASQAQPGDLLYYANGGGGQAHIAVYIGNGQAVHGGWEGHTTKVFSANVGSGPVFIRVA